MGTLGAGNHYAEVQVVDKVFDRAAARKMGIDQEGQVPRTYSPCPPMGEPVIAPLQPRDASRQTLQTGRLCPSSKQSLVPSTTMAARARRRASMHMHAVACKDGGFYGEAAAVYGFMRPSRVWPTGPALGQHLHVCRGMPGWVLMAELRQCVGVCHAAVTLNPKA